MSRHSTTAALLSLGFMELVRSGLWLAFIPLGAGEAGPAAALVGLALSVHYGTETLLKLAAGWLVDLYGARRILPASLACATGAAAVLAFFHASPSAMVAGAVLLGLCTAPAWLAVIQAVAPPAEASGGKMGAIWLAWLAGMGGGPVLTGIAMEYLPGWIIPVLLVAVMALACLAVLLFPPALHHASPADRSRPWWARPCWPACWPRCCPGWPGTWRASAPPSTAPCSPPAGPPACWGCSPAAGW